MHQPDVVASQWKRPRPVWPWLAGVAAMIAVASLALSMVTFGTSSDANRRSTSAAEDAARASAASAAVARAQAADAKAREEELRDVICGVYVPIGNATVLPTTAQLGRTIVAATKHGAVRIQCPGVKP